MNEKPKDDPLLLQMILVFQQTAWQSLGKIQNPQTGETKVDLGAASHAIDMLGMLDQKTRGNLTEAEQQILSNALTQLHLNFVEVKEEQAKTTPQDSQTAAEAEKTPESSDTKSDSE